MTTLDQDMAERTRLANSAQLMVSAAMQKYLAACVARNWKLAESAREEVLAAVEVQLDTVAMLHKRMEAAEHNGQ